MVAIKDHGYLLRYASDELRANKKLALAAVQKDILAIEYVADSIKSDKEFAEFFSSNENQKCFELAVEYGKYFRIAYKDIYWHGHSNFADYDEECNIQAYERLFYFLKNHYGYTNALLTLRKPEYIIEKILAEHNYFK